MASAPTRRDVLRLGALAGLGLSLPVLLRRRARAAATSGSTDDHSFGRAKSVIMLFLHGGHPQQETFDPKPHGPEAVRGEFGAISTMIPGVQFSELLPKIAAIADRLAVVRSMSHDNPNHVTACLPAQTGHKHPPNFPKTDVPPADSDFPPIGAVLDHLNSREDDAARDNRTAASGRMPTWVRLGPYMRRNNGTPLHGQTPGFLGAAHASFVVDQSLASDRLEIQAVRPADELTDVRLTARRNLLAQFDRQRRLIDRAATVSNTDQFYQRAFDLLTADAVAKAFDLDSESPETRDRYGVENARKGGAKRTEFGQRCLLARRLAEAGVPMINVSYCHTPSGSWDTHGDNFKKMKNSLAPTLDAALTALLDDLGDRGLLEDVLVVVNAEFGRTPKINKNAGRDHWPSVYSLALAGAGVNAGTIHGASDASAAYPTCNLQTPGDFAATLYHLLGVGDDVVVRDQLGRPHQLYAGRPIRELLGRSAPTR